MGPKRVKALPTSGLDRFHGEFAMKGGVVSAKHLPSARGVVSSEPWKGPGRPEDLGSILSFGAFVRELLANPRSIGAAFPSSRQLADRIASFIPEDFSGLLVELGAGTGAITSAILERGVHPKQVVSIECSFPLTQLLKRRFPDIHVLHGGAESMAKLLSTHLRTAKPRVDLMISSLPLRSLPKNLVSAIGHQVEQCLTEEGRFVQFTYDLRSDVSAPFPRFARCESGVVWLNIPPARVDVFERNAWSSYQRV